MSINKEMKKDKKYISDSKGKLIPYKNGFTKEQLRIRGRLSPKLQIIKDGKNICLAYGTEGVYKEVESLLQELSTREPVKNRKVKNWREGQTWFNFLQWLKETKGYTGEQMDRCADPFHIQDEDMDKLWEEYLLTLDNTK